MLSHLEIPAPSICYQGNTFSAVCHALYAERSTRARLIHLSPATLWILFSGMFTHSVVVWFVQTKDPVTFHQHPIHTLHLQLQNYVKLYTAIYLSNLFPHNIACLQNSFKAHKIIPRCTVKAKQIQILLETHFMSKWQMAAFIQNFTHQWQRTTTQGADLSRDTSKGGQQPCD